MFIAKLVNYVLILYLISVYLKYNDHFPYLQYIAFESVIVLNKSVLIPRYSKVFVCNSNLPTYYEGHVVRQPIQLKSNCCMITFIDMKTIVAINYHVVMCGN
jgi:hypothetical protein